AASIVLLAAATSAVLTLRAFPFALEGQPWPQGSNVVMQLSLGNGSGTLIDGFTSWGASADDALGRWNQQVAHFKFAAVRDSTVAPTANDGQNSAFFSSTIFGQSFGTTTLAVSVRQV